MVTVTIDGVVATLYGGRVLRTRQAMRARVDNSTGAYLAEWNSAVHLGRDSFVPLDIRGWGRTIERALDQLLVDTAATWLMYVDDNTEELTDDGRVLRQWLLDHFEEVASCHDGRGKGPVPMTSDVLDKLRELTRVLAIATERALERGEALVRRGGLDINRGQFERLAMGTLEELEQAGYPLSEEAAHLLAKYREHHLKPDWWCHAPSRGGRGRGG